MWMGLYSSWCQKSFGDANLKDLFEDQSQFLGYIMAVFNLLKLPGHVMHHQV